MLSPTCWGYLVALVWFAGLAVAVPVQPRAVRWMVGVERAWTVMVLYGAAVAKGGLSSLRLMVSTTAMAAMVPMMVMVAMSARRCVMNGLLSVSSEGSVTPLGCQLWPQSGHSRLPVDVRRILELRQR